MTDNVGVSVRPFVGVMVDPDSNVALVGLTTVALGSTSSGGSGAPVNASYLVTQANSTLTGEVVVGATPGGELAGSGSTWQSPKVTTTHAGTTHAAVQAAAEAAAAASAAALYQALSAKGQANGYADLDASGKVPAARIPGTVPTYVEYANLAAFPATGSTSTIYVALDTLKLYRWSGSVYVEVSASLALGETSSTAYRGDRGKTAYDHSQATGNPHGLTKTDLSLGNVDNTADASKTFAASQITSGQFAIARLASGTPTGSKFVRDDGTLAVPGSSGAASWVNVLDYATGDGTTNDTTAIGSAITAAGTGGYLWFPDGTYFCRPTSSAMKPLDGQTWAGPGLIQIDGAGQYGIDAQSTTGVTFDGLTIDGGGVSGSTANITTLLNANGATDFSLLNCELRNAVGPITNTSTSGRCALDLKDATRPTVLDCYFHDIGWHPGDDWKNYADTNGQCIRAHGAQDGIIARCEFTDHVSDAIFMGYGTRFTKNMRIAGNYIHDVMYAGINIFTSTSAGGTGGQGISGVVIQGNLIRRTNGVERGNRPGKRTITAINSGNGTTTVSVTLSGPIVGHSNGEKVQVFLPSDGTVRGDTFPGQTDTKASTSSQPASPMTSANTTPTLTLTFPVAATLAVGDQVAVIETGESSFGVYTRGGTTPADIQVLDNVIEYTNEPGIEVNDHPATVRGNTIRDTQWVSLTTASDRPGIYAASGSIIEGNTVINPWGHGITCEDQNYHSGTGQVSDSRGQVRTMVRNNTILGANYGGSYGSGGLRTSGWAKHYQNSIAHCGINFIADYGSITDCIVEGNVIGTADPTTYPVGYGIRWRVASGFTADASNLQRDNVLLDTPKDYSLRYPLNSTTTAWGYKAVTGATTLTAKDRLVICTGSTAYTMTLPLAVKGPLDGYTIRNDATAIVTLDANGSETIDGALTLKVYPGAAVTIRSDFLSGWYTTADAKNTLVGFTVVDKNADYTAAAGEHVRLGGGGTALSAGRTVTLPGSSSADGDEVMVTLADPSTFRGTIAPGSGTTLERNDGTNFVLSNRGASWIFRFDATNAVWRMRLASGVDRIRSRTYSDNTSITIDCSHEHVTIASLTGAGTTFAVPTGSKIDGQRLTLRITDTTPTGITFTTGSAGAFSTTTGGPALPTTTVNGVLYVEFIYNSATDRFELLRVT